MTHIICLHVENQQGVLARISGLFSGRGYNLESITAGVTADPTVTRITLACTGDDAVVEQIKKQLNRLIDVIKVTELTGVPSLNRELMLVKVNAKGPQRGEIFQVADVFKAQIMDVGHESMTRGARRLPGEDRRPHRAPPALRDRGNGAERRGGNGTKQKE